MIHGFKNNGLFHYCTLDTAIRFILPNRQLRISPLIYTNDPRENKSLVFGSFTNDPAISSSPTELIQMNKTVSDIIREDCKVLCLSYSDVLEGYQLSQMWAHYGDRHKGVCIAIDYDKFIMENESYFKPDNFQKISYVSPETLNETIITKRYRHVNMTLFNDLEKRNDYLKNDFRKENMDYLFFTKSIEWKYEQEARLIYFSDEKKDEYCSIRNSLTHVFLGVDFIRGYLPSVLSAIGDKNCKVWPLNYSGEWLSCLENVNK